jgi:iron complex outermembrane receptor protein
MQLLEPIMKMEVLPEKLNDFELGLASCRWKVKFNANFIIWGTKINWFYWELDDVGAQLEKNSGDSYRFGLELDATMRADKLCNQA